MRARVAVLAIWLAVRSARALLSAEAFRAHERLHGRVSREGPCDCGDCLSCEVQRMGRGIGADRAAWPGGAS